PSEYKPFLDFFDAVHVQGKNARCLAISGIALLVYDWLTTLDKEVEYTWGRKWSLARVVYYLNRVLPIMLIGAVLIPNVLFAPAHFTPSVQEGNIVLQLWCYCVIGHYLHYLDHSLLGAVWSKVRILSFPRPLKVLTWLILAIGHGVLQVTMNIDKSTIMANPLPGILRGCIVSIPHDMWHSYLAGVLYELAIFCLIMWRIWYLGDGLGLTPLMRQLLKNGVSFFAVNLALMLFSCVGSAYPSTVIIANGSGLLTALSSTMCSRIFFSMHDFASEDRVHVSIGPSPVSGVRGSAIFTGQFAIPLETFSDGSRSPSGLQVTFDTPPHSIGRSVSTKGKYSDKLCV
ncbi:unnamed protein product, partial [Rhizoctonia solani]